MIYFQHFPLFLKFKIEREQVLFSQGKQVVFKESWSTILANITSDWYIFVFDWNVIDMSDSDIY